MKCTDSDEEEEEEEELTVFGVNLQNVTEVLVISPFTSPQS